MATTITFKGVLETGISFLRVSIVIMAIVWILAGLGISSLEDRDFGAAAVMIGLAVLVLIAGIIGLSQKLISDAFLEGFKAAKEDGSVGDGTRMDTKQTLTSGFQVIGVIVLTFIVAGILFGIGGDMLGTDAFGREASSGESIIGSLFMGAGCAVMLSAMLGLFARVIAEGVSFGASSTGVTFVTDSEIVSSPTRPEEWSHHYKRLVFSTVALFVGYVLPWSTVGRGGWNPLKFSGFDILIDSDCVSCPDGWDGLFGLHVVKQNLDWLTQGDGGAMAIQAIIWELLPYVFIATFAFAWYKYSQGDEVSSIKAGSWHASIFGVYAVLVVITAFTDNYEIRYDHYEKYNYILFDRIGIWFAGLAGLGLIPVFTQKFSSSETESSDVRFDELDTDGDGVLSKAELEAADEFDEPVNVSQSKL